MQDITTNSAIKPDAFYQRFLEDISLSPIMFSLRDEKFTGEDLAEALRQGSDLGFEYVQALMFETQKLLLSAFRRKPQKVTRETMAKAPKDFILAMFQKLPAKEVVWQTISYGYTAEDLVKLYSKNDPVAVGYVTNLINIARDLLAFKANPDEM